MKTEQTTLGCGKTTLKLIISQKWWKIKDTITLPYIKFKDYVPIWIYHQSWLLKILSIPKLEGENWTYDTRKIGHKNILFGITIKTVIYKK